jgi:cellobiose epimerase
LKAVLDIAALREEVSIELTENILPYWMGKMVDEQWGGFLGRRNTLDEVVPYADKGSILNARILWTFSHAATVFKGTDRAVRYLQVAERAYDYLTDHFLDKETGGVYWMVDYQGKPVYTKKQVYAQAFTIYAFSEYYLATRSDSVLSKAIELFKLVEKYSFDKIENGYLEAFDRGWTLLDDLRLSDKDANEKKTMNTHLHVLEAYTNLYRCWKNPQLEKQLRNLVQIFIEKIIDKDGHMMLFFDEKWQSKSKTISFGHDIEGSWLLQEAAEVLGDESLILSTRVLAIKMVNITLHKGTNEHGAIINEIHSDGTIDTDCHWWPQAEALVGLVNAWQLTNNDLYLENAQSVWIFIKNKLINTTKGEWYWGVTEDGKRMQEDKAGPWKCPYHNGRALMELINRLEDK